MRNQNSSYHFKHLLKSSQSFACNKCVRFTYGLSNDKYLYFMLTKKYGNAPTRNVFKRRVRALFNNLTQQHSDLSLGVMIKPLKKGVSYQELVDCFADLNKKIILEKK